MFDNLYTRLIGIAPYRTLIFIPVGVTIFMLLVLLIQGIPLGIDFKGGTKMIITLEDFSDENEVKLRGELEAVELEDLDVSVGEEYGTGMEKLFIETISNESVIMETNVIGIIEKYTGKLRIDDVASIRLNEKPTKDTMEKLDKRFENADVEFDDASNTLTITSQNIDEEDAKSAIHYYFKDIDVENMVIEKSNFIYRPVSPTLGKSFYSQAINALIMAYILMSIVVFFVFRTFVPSGAVILAATCDIIIAAGAMSLLNIKLEPASIAALLMLIGYSVDTDILLTTRLLKHGHGEVNERINSAMKTGLTMATTTLVALSALFFVSSFVIRIEELALIASVLILGLMGDLLTTWFTNAGILKWYLSKPKKVSRRKSRFGIRIFSR